MFSLCRQNARRRRIRTSRSHVPGTNMWTWCMFVVTSNVRLDILLSVNLMYSLSRSPTVSHIECFWSGSPIYITADITLKIFVMILLCFKSRFVSVIFFFFFFLYHGYKYFLRLFPFLPFNESTYINICKRNAVLDIKIYTIPRGLLTMNNLPKRNHVTHANTINYLQ